MKIIHITAAYKPAFIYGGPTMSVAKLCEELVVDIDYSKFNETNDNSTNRSFDYATDVKIGTRQDDKFKVEVFTTTANGKQELEVETQQRVIVDGVNVTYFKRLTKDHTHFSPGLLLALRRAILMHQKNPPPTPPRNRSKLSKEPAPIYRRGQNSSLKKTYNEQRQTKNELLIHIHAWWNLVSVLSCFIAKWYQIPVVLSPRGMLTSYTQSNRNSFSKKLIHFVIGKRLLRYCHIHATSEQEKQDILSIIQPKSIKVIPNLVELGETFNHIALSSLQGEGSGVRTDDQVIYQQANNSTNQPDKLKLIFLSRIEEKKGLAILFEALALADFNFSLSIAGSGHEAYIDSLKAKAKDLKIDHQIIWLGQVKNEDKFKILQQHDMMVLSSYNENFANVVVESLSVGTAVMLSDQVGLSDYVKENDLGWISPLNVLAIAKNLQIAYKDTDKRNKISKLAPAFIARDFNDKTLAQRYIHLYTAIANGR